MKPILYGAQPYLAPQRSTPGKAERGGWLGRGKAKEEKNVAVRLCIRKCFLVTVFSPSQAMFNSR